MADGRLCRGAVRHPRDRLKCSNCPQQVAGTWAVEGKRCFLLLLGRGHLRRVAGGLVLKESSPVVPALSLRDGFLVWVVAIAFGIIGGIVAGLFFVGYHVRAAASALRSSDAVGKGTRR